MYTHYVRFSLSQFAEGGSHTVQSVGRVVEWGSVASAPRELSAHAGEHAVLVVVFGGQVGNFLLGVHEGLGARHERDNFEVGHLGEVANVAHGLELVKVTLVVGKVQHKVVLHGNVESLHLLGGVTAARNGCFDRVAGGHELIVLGVNFINDALGVNAGLVSLPVDGLGVGLGCLVVEVKNSLELGVRVLGLSSGGGVLKTTKPVVSELIGGGGDGTHAGCVT